jgi:hypothetical protein
VLLFGIGINVTAGIGAAICGWLDDYIGSKKENSAADVRMKAPVRTAVSGTSNCLLGNPERRYKSSGKFRFS